jgi:hypothetical protein
VNRSILILTIIALPVIWVLWGVAYTMAGDCPGLDDTELASCVTHKNFVGYVAIAIGVGVYAAIAWALKRKGRR